MTDSRSWQSSRWAVDSDRRQRLAVAIAVASSVIEYLRIDQLLLLLLVLVLVLVVAVVVLIGEPSSLTGEQLVGFGELDCLE